MSKALVRARGVATPDQFKTDWSQFMKQNIAMNMMIYPNNAAMDKSDAKITFKPAIPAAMVLKAADNEKVYVCVCFKDDANAWHSAIVVLTFLDFSASVDISGNNFFETAAAMEFAFNADDVTAGNVYDVHVVYSDKEINTEVAESANDLPYVLYGPASEYIIELTCAA